MHQLPLTATFNLPDDNTFEDRAAPWPTRLQRYTKFAILTEHSVRRCMTRSLSNTQFAS